jgi:RNA polymerase sigma-70 factor (ECF subfamily)
MQPTSSWLWQNPSQSECQVRRELPRPLSEQTDEQLMLLCQEGHNEALEELFRRYSRPLYHYVYRQIANSDTASDLVQEIFLRIYTHRKRYRPTSNFSYWLYRIAHNLCVDEKRRYWNRNVIESSNVGSPENEMDFMELQSTPSKDGADLLQEKEMEQLIRDAIDKLSEEQRQVMLMHKYQGMAYRDIAEVLGISTESVKQRAYRAHMRLRELLKPLLKETEA